MVPDLNSTPQYNQRGEKRKKNLVLPVRKSFIFAAGLKPLAAFFN